MTDRRRNLFVLLLVAGLLVASLVVIVTKPTRLGPRPQGRRLAHLPGQADEAGAGQQRRDRPHDRHHARARRPARRRRAGDPALGRGPDRRLAPGRQERRRGPAPGRHDGADVLLRLGDERPRRRLQAGPGEPERHGRPGGRQRGRGHQPLRRGQAREQLQAARLRRRDDHRSTSASTTRPRRSLAGPGETRPTSARAAPAQRHRAEAAQDRRGPAGHGRRPRRAAPTPTSKTRTAGTSCRTSRR